MVAHQVAGWCRRAVHRAGRRPGIGERLERPVEGVQHAIELHAHLEGERPAGVVVGRHRRPARIRDVVGVLLRLEHVEHVRPERLRRLHHERPGGIAAALHGEIRRGTLHGDAGREQRAGKLHRGQEVGLVGRQDVAARIALPRVAEDALEDLGRHRASTARIGPGRLNPSRHRGPRVAAPALDGVAPHPVDVEEQRFAVARREVEHRAVGGHRVFDRLAEPPRLRRNRIRQIAARQLALGHERNRGGRRPADRLGEKADLIVEVGGGPQAAVPPGRVAGAAARRHPGLAFGGEARLHRRADQVDAGRE